MRTLLEDKSLAEKLLRNSDLPYTIIRPVPLTDGPATGRAALTASTDTYGAISRADLAALLVAAARSERCAGRTLTALDRGCVLVANPFVRPLEEYEAMPYEEFQLS
ncbi:unnamed protein product [Phaeothamnion confervicola]